MWSAGICRAPSRLGNIGIMEKKMETTIMGLSRYGVWGYIGVIYGL